jgi:hypothetical protein
MKERNLYILSILWYIFYKLDIIESQKKDVATLRDVQGEGSMPPVSNS